MQAPVPSAHQDDPMASSEGQPMSRKRSHSVMSDRHLAQNLADNISAMTNGLVEQQHEDQQQANPYEQQPYPEAQQQPYPHDQQHHPYTHDQQQLQQHEQQQAQEQAHQQDHQHEHQHDHQHEQTMDHQQEQHQDLQGSHYADQRRSNSVASGDAGSQAGEYSPRGSRAFKRGDPPRNEANKYICNYADECVGITFDRKCEWSKHMDKHDRPYRCPHASCAKLQGFTYSGGLLRHEREVHGKHGGPKSALMCPFTECKRHTGKGFTRKENLNEHLRRVHSGKEPLDSQSSALHHELTEAAAAAGAGPGAAQDEDTQASRLSETATAATEHDAFNLNSPNGLKRKRSFSGVGEQSFEEVEAMRRQLDHLHAENARKEEIIRQMGEEAALRDERLRAAEEALARVHNGQQV
ncbi:unnamed protein product [Zymoseptoria tritici ST99CH_1A5]|uniref:C2H2-type domain-containing protein n=2 Tax=Zymoseptoria tritici TaxID=1047171 RepID=A0A1Y6LAU4_ZYMTR|nr:unnamed protein product [Zymoseptoria tritici ST99CH_1A5]